MENLLYCFHIDHNFHISSEMRIFSHLCAFRLDAKDLSHYMVFISIYGNSRVLVTGFRGPSITLPPPTDACELSSRGVSVGFFLSFF